MTPRTADVCRDTPVFYGFCAGDAEVTLRSLAGNGMARAVGPATVTPSKKEAGMSGLEVKSLSSPEETRPFSGKGHADVVSLSTGPVGKAVFEPGWRWSEHIKPIAHTESCEAAHLGYVLSGRMHIVMDDGSEGDLGPGDAFSIAPGHDAWTVGEEPCVMVDFGRIEHYAKAG